MLRRKSIARENEEAKIDCEMDEPLAIPLLS